MAATSTRSGSPRQGGARGGRTGRWPLSSWGDKAFFIYGFAKNERASINDKEERALKSFANELLGYDASTIMRALNAGALRKLRCNDE